MKIFTVLLFLANLAMSVISKNFTYSAYPPILGIDLGENYSTTAIYLDGEIVILKDKTGDSSIPSVVAFTDERILFGRNALEQVSENKERTIK